MVLTVLQIRELVEYLARGRTDDERTAFIKPYQDALLTAEGNLPLPDDKERQRSVILLVLDGVKSLGVVARA